MDRSIFDCMMPKELSREQLKSILKGNSIAVYDLLKMVGFVESKSDFKRQLKDRALSIESGELNFVNITDENMEVKLNSFIQDRLLFKKGKTQFNCVKI